MPQYMVIENTPGYLPENDDPATFDNYEDAAEAAIEQALRYKDDPDGKFTIQMYYHPDDFHITIEDHDKTYDLGRVITIAIVEEES